MKTSTCVRVDIAADHRRSFRAARPQNVLAGIVLACIVLACGWTLVTHGFEHGFGHGFGTRVVAAEDDPDLSGRRISFAERFEPAVTAPLTTPKYRNTYMALFDPTYSLRAPPDRFSTGERPRFERRLVASAVALLTEDPPQQIAPPPAIEAALSIPLPAPRPAALRLAQARAAVLAVTAPDKPSIFEKLYGKPQSAPVKLAYASADAGVTGESRGNLIGAMPLYDRSTAVYDITARTVYLPNGTKLEAHSGLGSKLDDPRYAHVKMHGATPPHLYDLSPREALFHGVAALRMTPVGGAEAIFGRTGLLAHNYLLGPNGDSNGCVSFKDYDAFLQAYRNGEIKRLAVVARVE